MRDSCIQHPPRTQFLMIRQDYLAICDNDHCQAALLSNFEHWHTVKVEHQKQARIQNVIARKGKQPATQDESLWVYKRQADLRADMLGLFSVKKITAAIDKLVERGFVQTRFNPKQKWDRTKQYLFNCGPVQFAINQWQNASSTAPVDNRQNGELAQTDISPNGEIDLAESPDRFSQTAQAIPLDNNRDNNNDGNTLSQPAIAVAGEALATAVLKPAVKEQTQALPQSPSPADEDEPPDKNPRHQLAIAIHHATNIPYDAAGGVCQSRANELVQLAFGEKSKPSDSMIYQLVQEFEQMTKWRRERTSTLFPSCADQMYAELLAYRQAKQSKAPAPRKAQPYDPLFNAIGEHIFGAKDKAGIAAVSGRIALIMNGDKKHGRCIGIVDYECLRQGRERNELDYNQLAQDVGTWKRWHDSSKDYTVKDCVTVLDSWQAWRGNGGTSALQDDWRTVEVKNELNLWVERRVHKDMLAQYEWRPIDGR